MTWSNCAVVGLSLFHLPRIIAVDGLACAKTEKLVNDILDFAEARKVRRNIIDTQ